MQADGYLLQNLFRRQPGPNIPLLGPVAGLRPMPGSWNALSAVLEAPNGMLEKCPVCGHTKTIRNGRYCAKCLQPMENVCDSNGKGAHSCGANDRFCRICGSETLFRKEGFLPDYRESEVFGQLMKEEPQHRKKRIRMNRILILPDGRLRVHGQDQRT